MLLTCREPRVLKLALFFRLYPLAFTLSAADVPAIPGAKNKTSAWLPCDERDVPLFTARLDRCPVPGNRAAEIAIASGPGWADAEYGHSMGKC
jgi:hypothetical protein